MSSPQPPLLLVEPATCRVDAGAGAMDGGTGARRSRNCYPADPGQNYDIIARATGMRTLIVACGDGWCESEKPRYQPRSEAEQRRYFEAGR